MAKYALCVGINKYDFKELSGAENDANDWADRFQNGLGFDEVQRLVTKKTAEKQPIVDAITAVLKKAKSGDLLVITLAGHGISVQDDGATDADPDKGLLDEAFCPSDFDGAVNYLLDDELFNLFQARPDGVELVLIADCCSAGNIAARMPGPGRLERLLRWFFPNRGAQRVRSLPESVWTQSGRADAQKYKQKLKAGNKGQLSKALVMSACQGDGDEAIEKVRDGRSNGVYTRAALDTLKKKPATYAKWHALIKQTLKDRKCIQQPQLEGTAAQKQTKVLAEKW